jgi:hypothetical protein
MDFVKNIYIGFIDFIRHKQSWISMLISILFWFPLMLLGGYIAFITNLEPTYKTILIILLMAGLWMVCYLLKRIIFKSDPK